MRQFETVNILDMIGAIGEMKLQQLLSDFSCPFNPEIEHFIMNNAIEFAKKKLSVTYFVINENGKIIAIFTLAHKAIEIGDMALSNAKRKKINRYAILDTEAGSYTISAFLISFNFLVLFFTVSNKKNNRTNTNKNRKHLQKWCSRFLHLFNYSNISLYVTSVTLPISILFSKHPFANSNFPD